MSIAMSRTTGKFGNFGNIHLIFIAPINDYLVLMCLLWSLSKFISLTDPQITVVTISRMLRCSSRSSVIGEHIAVFAAVTGGIPSVISWAA